mmetsp:Transcript_41855/g.80111  ORF Transcript_41855/g.80111 Transcript_41855/m.80111 type:complete len:347 (-) Transcript_41855:561-1601(-)
MASQHAYSVDAASESQSDIIGQLEEIVMAQAQRNAQLEAKLDETKATEQKFMTLLEGSSNGGASVEHAGVDFHGLTSAASHNPELEAAIGRHLLQLADVGDSSSFDGRRIAALQMKATAHAKQNAELQAQIKEMKRNEEAHLATIAQLRQEADRDVRRNCELEVEVDKMQQVVQDYLTQIGKLRDAVTLAHQQEVSMKEMRTVERDLRNQVTELKAVISVQSKRLVETEAAVLAMSQREQDYEYQVSQLRGAMRGTEAQSSVSTPQHQQQQQHHHSMRVCLCKCVCCYDIPCCPGAFTAHASGTLPEGPSPTSFALSSQRRAAISSVALAFGIFMGQPPFCEALSL